MKNLNTPTPPAQDENATLQNNAIRIGQITLGLGVLMILYGIYSFIRNPDIARGLFLGLYAALAFVGVFAIRLSKSGRSNTGSFLVITAILVVLLLVGILLKGLGFIFMMLAILMVSAIAFQTLTGKKRLWAIVASLAVGVFVFVFDLTVSALWRREALLSPQATGIMAGIITVGYFSVLLSQFRSLSLRTKLIIAFLAVTIIPLVIISYVTYNASTTTLTNNANQRLEEAAKTTANTIDTFINNNLEHVRAVAQFPVVVEYLSMPAEKRAGSPEEKRALDLITAFSRQDPVFISSVGIFDKNGIDLLDTIPSDIGTNKADRTYVAETLRTALPYASDVEYSSTTGVPSIYFAAPTYDANGKIIGLLRIRYPASILQKLIIAKAGLAGETSYAILLEKEHHIRLAHSTDRQKVFKTIVPLDAGVAARLQEQGLLPAGAPQELATNLNDFEAKLNNLEQEPYFSTETDADGALEQAATATIATKNWLIVFIQDQNVFLAPIAEQTANNLTIAVLVALATAVVGFYFSQTLSNPLVRLTEVAEKIAGGDINIQAQVESQDEIGALAATFNRMTQQLRDFIVSLEERVTARTKDLATVAEVSTRTATILDPYQMLATAVHLTQRGFDLYHCHVFTYNKEDDNLHIVACGYREGDEHEGTHGTTFIPLQREQSLVARAGRTRKPVIVNDVRSDPGWLPNPMLPETRAELAVPMLVGDELLGVLDVQADHVDAFTEQSANIQQTLASQLATALKNAQSYTAAQSQAEYEALVSDIIQKIQRANSVEETLQTAVSELGIALGATRVVANLDTQKNFDAQKN